MMDLGKQLKASVMVLKNCKVSWGAWGIPLKVEWKDILQNTLYTLYHRRNQGIRPSLLLALDQDRRFDLRVQFGHSPRPDRPQLGAPVKGVWCWKTVYDCNKWYLNESKLARFYFSLLIWHKSLQNLKDISTKTKPVVQSQSFHGL